MAKYLQGRFVPKNPDKYTGDVSNIFFRSSWENKVMILFDNNPNFLKWSSEETIVPYISPIDGKYHRYFPDFMVKYRNRSGAVINAMVEVKPFSQTKLPVKKNKMTKRFITEAQTYMVNEAKWIAAKEWCNKHGYEFMILTEKDLKV